ncbi:alpha/beta hydrolase family protein [Chryseobacterium koreense]|uniref:hypothetical protein n=1 Tax=Chryseobacterium koreense TaxID=232216 RepID=UPI000A44E3F7|nr:hypothetical protein [Chryseobacterium koreense]MBB5334309.1 hypothetical protein [Chryseobacterium koreense]
MSKIKALGIPKIKALGLNNMQGTTEEHLKDMIIQVYWTTVKPNGNDIPVSKALLGEKVYLAVKTKGVPNNTSFLVRIYEYNRITKNKKLFDTDVIIKNNFGTTKELYLEKNEKWLDLLKETGEDNELELYAEISAYGETVAGGKYLKVRNSNKVVVFFIGGAADKTSYGIIFGPDQNILPAKKNLENKILNRVDYNSYYLGFEEVYDVPSQTNRVEENVLQNLDKNSSIYIVGHSLGGWNGAHLSQILSDKGYNVEMLITLDPVGEGLLVYVGSSIYKNKPHPKSKFWINILADPSTPDGTDDVAEFGVRWKVSSGPNINVKMDINHWNARKMFETIIKDKKSCLNYLYDNIKLKI